MKTTKAIIFLIFALCTSGILSATYSYPSGYDNSTHNQGNPYQQGTAYQTQSYEHVPYYNPNNPGAPLADATESSADVNGDVNGNESDSSSDSDESSSEGSGDCASCDDEGDDEDEDECPKCDFILSGDWLWWRAHKCELDYAIPYNDAAVSPDVKIGKKIHHVCPRWHSGFRVAAFKACEGLQYGIRYTHFSDCSYSSVTDLDGNLAATRPGIQYQHTTAGSIQWAQASYDFDYDIIDVEAAYSPEMEDYSVRIFAGARLAYIDQELKTRYAEDVTDKKGVFYATDFIKQKVELDAYGAFFGLGGGANICGCLGAFVETSWGVALGFFDRKFTQKGYEGGAYIKNTELREACYRVVSNFDFTAGLSLDVCGPCCTKWLLKAGYEFHHWWNTADFIQVSENLTGEKHKFIHHTDSLGFDGVFVRLQTTF